MILQIEKRGENGLADLYIDNVKLVEFNKVGVTFANAFKGLQKTIDFSDDDVKAVYMLNDEGKTLRKVTDL